MVHWLGLTDHESWGERLWDYYSHMHSEEGKDKPGDKCFDALTACKCQPAVAPEPAPAPGTPPPAGVKNPCPVCGAAGRKTGATATAKLLECPNGHKWEKPKEEKSGTDKILDDLKDKGLDKYLGEKDKTK